mmetsp:Transcript_5512/g.15668  ORF Transcript_5512/g.15668 Transcript_5512/m.15668 type:complete len:205 (-) Transcript_5512:8-622(-)
MGSDVANRHKEVGNCEIGKLPHLVEPRPQRHERITDAKYEPTEGRPYQRVEDQRCTDRPCIGGRFVKGEVHKAHVLRLGYPVKMRDVLVKQGLRPVVLGARPVHLAAVTLSRPLEPTRRFGERGHTSILLDDIRNIVSAALTKASNDERGRGVLRVVRVGESREAEHQRRYPTPPLSTAREPRIPGPHALCSHQTDCSCNSSRL